MTPTMQAVTTDPFPASYSDHVRKIGVVNTKNKVLTRSPARMLDGPAALRSYLINNVIIEGFTFDEVMRDDEALEAFVRKSTIGVWHASCTLPHGRRRRSDGGDRSGGARARRSRGCASSMPRSSRWCRAPTPTSRC